MQTLFAFYAAVMAIYLIGVRVILWRWMTPTHKRVFIVLNIITLPIYALYFFKIGKSPEELPFWSWFLDVNEEFGMIATYSAMILMVTGFAAFTIGVLIRANIWQRAFWLINGAVFVFLALDEYYLIHETVHGLVGVWQILYAGFGVTLVILATVFWWRGRQYNWTLFGLYLIGLGVIGASGIALDYIFQELACRNPELGIICADLNLIEELFETLGACYVLSLFFAIAAQSLTTSGVRRFAISLASVAAIWLFWAIGYWWIFPSVEMRLLAQPVNVDFDGGRVTLIGYRLDDRELEAGSTLHLTTYWRANETITRMYQVSAHVLTGDFNSIAQDNPDAAWFPTHAWLPGVTIRQNLNIPIPSDLEAPYGYRIGVSFWDFFNPQREITVNGDLPLLFGETVELVYVTALLEEALPPAPDSFRWMFENGVTVRGYTLPLTASAGDTITLQMWWQAGDKIVRDYQQYLHLVSVDNPSENFVLYDQIPAGGDLPTASWVEGLAFVDSWQLTLPDDISTGDYEIISGLFSPFTGQRLSVTGVDDAPIRDNSMILGIITITGD